MPDASQQSSVDTLLGRLIVDRGLATVDEVKDCLKSRHNLNVETGPNQQSLADMLIERGIVTPAQLERIKPEIDATRAGRQIPGYQILSKLGQGAMATVYLAKQISLDRNVAIKILPKKYSDNEEFIRRFYDEGKAAAQLNHPNIVSALDVGKAGQFHYFVMEYVEGRTVYDDIVEKGAYPERESLSIALQIAEALAHAHAKGFIHRDVKPKNIMFTQQGIAKLADMGLARAISDRAAAEAEQGKAYGTPYYISPEQIRGRLDVDFRADIYSFGATLYHMVTGQVPYDGPNPSAVMHKHLKTNLIAPDHINESLSTGISEIIEVCMAKDVDNRYTNTQELINDLKAVIAGEPPVQARRKVDVAQLQTLASGTDVERTDDKVFIPPITLTESPLFWFALVGWGAFALATLAAIIAAG